MTKPHGDTALSTSKGFKVGSYIQLDCALYQVISSLEARLKKLEEKLDERDKTIESLRAERGASVMSGGARTSGNATAMAVQAAPTSYASAVRAKPVNTAADVLELIVKEKRELASKQASVVISGLVEDNDPAADQANVEKLILATGGSLDDGKRRIKSRRVGRVAATDGRPRLVFVDLIYKDNHENVLEGAKRLKNSENYSRVYIRPDLTRHEVLLENELRAERNERNARLPHGDGNTRYDTDKNDKKWYWGVRWNELVHIDRETRRAFKPALH